MTSAVAMMTSPEAASPPWKAAGGVQKPATAALMLSGGGGGGGGSAGSAMAGSGKDAGWLTLEVCREFARQRCGRTDAECRYAHPPPHVDVQNGRVVCCFDSIKVDL